MPGHKVCIRAGKSKAVLADISAQKEGLGGDLVSLAEQHRHISTQLEEAQSAAQAVHVLAELQQRLQEFDTHVATGMLSRKLTPRSGLMASCRPSTHKIAWHVQMFPLT